jgi:hypothetical protein
MAYDEELADRIRAALAGQPAVREVRMFGGLSFMVDEKLAIGIDAHGRLIVRCDPARVDDLLDDTSAEQAEMNGRTMSRGWLAVRPENLTGDEDLGFWIRLALQRRGR